MKKITFICLALFSVISQRTVICDALEKNSNPMVRVCIMDDKVGIRLTLKGGFIISSGDSGKTLLEGDMLNGVLAPSKDGFRIGKRRISSRDIRIRALKESHIYVDGRRFRGDVEAIRKDNGKGMFINHVPLEDYLYGVLHHEVSHRWPMEALKAQAIAARTFALYHARQNKMQPYDLRSDIYSQVYGGSSSEKWATTKAVDLTRGMVLSYNGDIFPAYYHATCAGHTEGASSLWKIDMPPLKGVGCDFCRHSPHYRWKKVVPLWELKDKLTKSGYKIGAITQVNVLSRNTSERVDKIEVKGEEGTSVIFIAKDFRQLLGPNVIRSTNFDIIVRWGELEVNGLGWGHGVGMCQWGAYGMSLEGKSAEEVLKHYYPGAEIEAMDKLP